MLTTQTTSAGETCRSAEIDGSAMLAMATSSEAIDSAVKIAAIAQGRWPGGRPSAEPSPASFEA